MRQIPRAQAVEPDFLKPNKNPLILASVDVNPDGANLDSTVSLRDCLHSTF